MHHIFGSLVIGMVGGALAGKRGETRPVLRNVVKGGLVAKRKITAAGFSIAGEAKKLVEEARADLDRTQTEQHS